MAGPNGSAVAPIELVTVPNAFAVALNRFEAALNAFAVVLNGLEAVLNAFAGAQSAFAEAPAELAVAAIAVRRRLDDRHPPAVLHCVAGHGPYPNRGPRRKRLRWAAAFLPSPAESQVDQIGCSLCGAL